ncbi:pleckstrin homology domain-containing protein 1 [Phtheirospermum japonicum]|uniref:Pleckstrin homology domain-containing protein 1 n=1 Tax=Phtheirospermum japonicum TaxID=374723 RepID=A0A830CUJ7_9LAMI|nr:pleckstrin homology domain-containing protein 1 [Phtheirospermum japonicum]
MTSRDVFSPSRPRLLRRREVLWTLEHAGWLTKQGEYIKTWRRHWFILKQGKVFWFKESTVTRASRPRVIIPVANYLTVKDADDVLHRQYAFELSTQLRRCTSSPIRRRRRRRRRRIGSIRLG